jgi:hypothetical protein
MAGDTTSGVPNQAGVLEGSNPSEYNASDPIVLFIIQVSKYIPRALAEVDSDQLRRFRRQPSSL